MVLKEAKGSSGRRRIENSRIVLHASLATVTSHIAHLDKHEEAEASYLRRATRGSLCVFGKMLEGEAAHLRQQGGVLYVRKIAGGEAL